MVRLAPFVVFAYVVAGLVAARSEAPVVLGRYSHAAAALIVICGAVYLAAFASRRSARQNESVAPPGLEAVALLALIALTFAAAGSNAVQRLPLVQYVLPLVRILAAAALIAREAARARAAGAPKGPALAAAVLLLVWGSGDLIIAVATRRAPPHAEAASLAFREPHDLHALPGDAIVLIGDSFVWGQGVDVAETFGAGLERELQQQGRATRVYSLGMIGAGLRTYQQIVSALPLDRQVDRIVLVFYMNDMPTAPRLAASWRSQMIALGVGSPTLRIVGDLYARWSTPTLDDYHAQVVGDYDPADATFNGRWNALRRELSAFKSAATPRSRRTPMLVVLPLMVDFAAYPLGDAHRRLEALGIELGLQVVDLLPVFREQLGDGRRHLVAAGDNHFDAAAHAVVARALTRALGGL